MDFRIWFSDWEFYDAFSCDNICEAICYVLADMGRNCSEIIKVEKL